MPANSDATLPDPTVPDTAPDPVPPPPILSRSWALADGAAPPPGRPVHTDRAPAGDPAHPAGAGVNANRDEQDPENSPPADDTTQGLDRPIGAAAPDVDPDHPSGRPPSENSARRGRAPHQAAERGADEPPG